MSILLVEPICHGFEHAKVNAALIAAIEEAQSFKNIYLAGENGHVQSVNEMLVKNRITLPISFEINLPQNQLSPIVRLWKELLLFLKIIHYAKKNNINRILFLSITSSGLWAVKALALFYKAINFICIPHSILASIVQKPSIVPWKFPFWFGFPFSRLTLKNVRFIVLSPSIQKEIELVFPKASTFCFSIDFPYFFSSDSIGKKTSGSSIKFGALGVGHPQKGTDHFITIAKRVHQSVSDNRSEFYIIGPITDISLLSIIDDNIICPSKELPLSEYEFGRYISSMDYAVFCQNQEHYRFGVSGALLDAIVFAKPIIALRSSSFEHYFDIIGEIGILCDSLEDIYQAIIKIIMNPSREQYEMWVSNIKQNKNRISLKNIGSRITEIINRL